MSAAFSFISENLWAAFLIALFFGGSIFVHELGHFLVARWKGLYVERFSIGFGPPIWSWRGRDGVEYRLSWFPLGGYVLLPQLADLSAIEGKSQVDVRQVVVAGEQHRPEDGKQLPPVSYGAKMLTFVAGAVFNILFAFALACIIWVVGQQETRDIATHTIGYVTRTMEVGGKKVTSPAYEAGLRPGDLIQSIDGSTVHDWGDVNTLIKLSSGRTPAGDPEIHLTVDRAGQPLRFTVHPLLGGDEHYRQIGINPQQTLILAKIAPKSAVEKAGFQTGDTLLRVLGQPLLSPYALPDLLQAHAGQPVPFTVQRGSGTVDLALTPAAGTGPGGAATASGFVSFTSPLIRVHPSPVSQIVDEVVTTVRTVESLINPHSDVGLNKMTGVIGIVQVYHDVAPEGLIPVMALTILINVNLAILNLLPVPVLDGGQMLFATIAWIRGRSLPMNLIVTTQSIFMMAIVVLMVYIGWFDILRWRHG